MKYYIYPRGGNAQYIKCNLEFLLNLDFADVAGGGGDISLLDDKDKSLLNNLQSIKEDIENFKCKFLLASYKHENRLLENLRQLGITKCYDGIDMVSNLVNKYYKEKYKNKKLIAIALNGYEISQKHLGDIPQILKKSGFSIIYIVSLSSQWANELIEKLKLNSEEFILADYEFLEALDFFPMVIEQKECIRFNRKVASLKLFTSADMIQNYAYLDKEIENSIELGFFLCSYLNIHSKSHFDYIAKKQEFSGFDPNPTTKFIRGGYPSCDKDIGTFIDNGTFRDSVIFVSTHLNFEYPKRLAKLIKMALDSNFRVIFKSNPAHCECEKLEREFVKDFLKYDNFIFYDNSTPRLNIDELQRSITLVESCSSMLYSYPITTKRPSIIMYPKRTSLSDDILNNDCFYNDKIHIRIFEEDDSKFVLTLKELQKENMQKIWREKIENYCNNDLYNFGNASEYIANWITKWYENREVLIR